MHTRGCVLVSSHSLPSLLLPSLLCSNHISRFSSLPLPSQTALASTRKNDSKIVQEKAHEKMAPDIDASGATAGLLSAPETACESESCSA